MPPMKVGGDHILQRRLIGTQLFEVDSFKFFAELTCGQRTVASFENFVLQQDDRALLPMLFYVLEKILKLALDHHREPPRVRMDLVSPNLGWPYIARGILSNPVSRRLRPFFSIHSYKKPNPRLATRLDWFKKRRPRPSNPHRLPNVGFCSLGSLSWFGL